MERFDQIKLPASAVTIHQFISTARSSFERDLNTIQEIVSENLQKLQIYKIYGRSDKQHGEQLKSARKIRLKFNSYHLNKRNEFGSVWDIPDIIGFTIVVSYPSDISDVCNVIDRLIESGQIQSAFPPEKKIDRNLLPSVINTKFGRPITEGGYFACHYNLRTATMGSNRPICEIQIKTILHDAWGAKSHDLTYKPSTPVDLSLIESFNLLGDTLAKIDQQSDLIRKSIEKISSVRVQRRMQIQSAAIESTARLKAKDNGESEEIISRLFKKDYFSKTEKQDLIGALTNKYRIRPDVACIGYSALAVRSRDEICYSQAQEAFEEWRQTEEGELERIRIRSIAALSAFAFGDTGSAIEEMERAISDLDQISLEEHKLEDVSRLGNSMLSTLAYYHADQIGSHSGKQQGSWQAALDAIVESRKWRKFNLKMPPSIAITNDELERFLCDEEYGRIAFHTLDNEVFVLIHTARCEEEIRYAMERLHFVHEKTPLRGDREVKLLFSYHELCARTVLSELERL